jgi:dienelactone hydrolase
MAPTRGGSMLSDWRTSGGAHLGGRAAACHRAGMKGLVWLALLALALPAVAEPGAPRSCAEKLAGEARVLRMEVPGPGGRTVPLTIFAPRTAGTYPLIAFSHGAFAAPDRYAAMLEPLAAAGFVVIAPMHIDSEDYPRSEGEPERPAHPVTWSTRNADFALALDPPRPVRELLAHNGLALDPERRIALGHSYGGLIAQLRGGALALEPDGSQIDRTDPAVDAVIAWSPPGVTPGLITREGWASLVAPSLTITGTADVLPGFIDDWQAHKASHDNAPPGARALWVGEGIDHYFGGVFGRVKPVSERERRLFDRALATTLHFIESHSGISPACRLGASLAGETYEED